MKNKMADLRNHLFATLEALRDEEKPMDVERAKAIRDVAQTVINSAKVEVDFLEATGETPSDEFFGKPLERGFNGTRQLTNGGKVAQ